MHDSQNNFIWKTCPRESNKNVWYGISTKKETLEAAVLRCSDMGPLKSDNTSVSKLIWVDNSETDKCVYDLMRWVPQGDDEKVYIGAYYENSVGELPGGYKWIDYKNGNGNNVLFQRNALKYTHFVNDSVTPPVWVPDFPSEPPKDLAVAAYLDKNAKYFGEYGWVPVNPYETHFYICRIDCNAIDGGFSMTFSFFFISSLFILF